MLRDEFAAFANLVGRHTLYVAKLLFVALVTHPLVTKNIDSAKQRPHHFEFSRLASDVLRFNIDDWFYLSLGHDS